MQILHLKIEVSSWIMYPRAWLPDEELMHINVLELKEILLALN